MRFETNIVHYLLILWVLIVFLFTQSKYLLSMNAKKRIIFVVNPISGTRGKEAIIRMVEEKIDREKYEIDICKTQYAGHAAMIARQAALDHIDMVVAIGGDGTINEVGRSLIQTQTALGIIPCGSGNGLARHLQIPLHPAGAIQVINDGHHIEMDYGLIDKRHFFCTCGVGFDAFVSLKFANAGKRGLLTYLENTLHESLTYCPETYEIENSEGTMKYKAFLIACANASQYGNNAYIAPQASLTDGMMDITILEPFTVLDVPSLSFQLFNKTIDQNSRIKTLKDRKIIIHRAAEGVFHFDGDPVMGGKDLEVEIISRGLKIMVPTQKKAGRAEMFGIWQHLADFFETRPLRGSIAEKHRQLLQINQNLLRKLSKH